MSDASSETEAATSAWILAQRPPRAPVDPFQPYGYFLEEERNGAGAVIRSGGILLTNKECPWRCLMCDLWQHTLTSTVPLGAIPRQIDFALERLGSRPDQLKLYNAGSFFDPAAIPPADYPAIARRVAFARHLVVECHPRLVGPRALRFSQLLSPTLEVALGLETIHPDVLPRLNKRFSLDDFARAVAWLRNHGMSARAFVLVKPPFLNEREGIEWAVKSAAFAFDCGVEAVSLIPTRPGNGALERLREVGAFAPPTLPSLETAAELALALGRGRVFADTWDLKQFSTCPACFEPRRQRLNAMNLEQRISPRVPCPTCGTGGDGSGQ